ncbi:MFS transporter [Microbacterium sp.]|uniref:MFS transporter n=1 Tax=Microbacterium sp. TaxID=51671 RepID=UPI003C746703
MPACLVIRDEEPIRKSYAVKAIVDVPPTRAQPRPGEYRLRPTVLLSSQLLFNVGFFAVVPFLAGILRDDFALAGSAVGLVLGVRTAAQQGLFLFGGALADRFGARPLILTGCAVRVAGFSLLAWSTMPALGPTDGLRLPLFIVATVLTGLGGALFSPALETLVARVDAAPHARRTTLFALLAVFGETGAAAGPLLGALLLGWGFPTVAAAGALLFAAVAVALAGVLPGAPPRHGTPSAPDRPHPLAVLGDRRFVALAVLASVNLFAYNQLYLGLPVELDRVDAGPQALAVLFAWVSVATIALQLPIARAARRIGETRALRLGYLLISAAFGVLAIAAPVTPASGIAAVAPAFAATTLLALGHLVLTPLVLSLVPRFGPRGAWGSYYGLLATCGGAVVLVGNTLLGALYAVADAPGLPAIAPWAVLAALPLASAWLVPRLVPAGPASL